MECIFLNQMCSRSCKSSIHNFPQHWAQFHSRSKHKICKPFLSIRTQHYKSRKLSLHRQTYMYCNWLSYKLHTKPFLRDQVRTLPYNHKIRSPWLDYQQDCKLYILKLARSSIGNIRSCIVDIQLRRYFHKNTRYSDLRTCWWPCWRKWMEEDNTRF